MCTRSVHYLTFHMDAVPHSGVNFIVGEEGWQLPFTAAERLYTPTQQPSTTIEAQVSGSKPNDSKTGSTVRR